MDIVTISFFWFFFRGSIKRVNTIILIRGTAVFSRYSPTVYYRVVLLVCLDRMTRPNINVNLNGIDLKPATYISFT